VVLVVALQAALLAPGAVAAAVVLDQADYVFTGSNEPSAPDWTKDQTGTPSTLAVPGVGLAIADPDNASSLIYTHATSALSGDSADPRFRNTARISATVQTSPVPDNSPAWTADAVGWRLILDDGLHRAELALARDGATKARLVRLQDAPTALPIPFGWDNDFPNTYTIERSPPGDFTATFTVTVMSGDPAANPRSVSRTYFGAQLAVTQLSTGGRFAWGAGLDGGGTSYWREVHAQVAGEQVLDAVVDVNPKTINQKAKGQYITAYIQFPGSALDPTDIDVTTVTLQVIDPVTSAKLNVGAGSPTGVADGNGDGVLDLMVKFDRATVQAWFSGDTAAVFRVEGRLLDGRQFSGDDASVRIINAGVDHPDEANPASVKY
jgi:hypothetical protein